jgi:AcrR family transcriptional regulator
MQLSRKERDRLLREEDFLLAARKLFAEKGYHTTSMEEIARQAEYATGTLYRYFKDKEDLYTSLLEREAQVLLDQAEELIAHCPDSFTRLKTVIQVQVEFYEQHHDFFRLFVASGQLIDPTLGGRLTKRIEDLHQRGNAIIEAIISKAIEDKTIRPFPIPLLCRGLAGLTEGVLSQYLVDPAGETSQSIADLIFKFFWSGAGQKSPQS